ncbi:beta-lactamase family protein [Rheinheimera sp. UJ51]|uniref:serine hydrolase domain-containing protein n=1 Tax=Rheinheimera sp. UJ51 TaxID=2892446 RepID=UPI001E2B7938|nr:serine hydrolase domain-containing protein [Rheinheimera sp. UJ51]MCC5452711.1 beta-lactamase family protein [Rheinheimera sp. UJ51]
MKPSLMFIGSLLLSISTQAADLSGHWRGVLPTAPNSGITLAFELQASGDSYQLLLKSPNQSPNTIPVSSMRLQGNTLDFTVDALKAAFTGTFDGETLSGTFTQGRPMPLTLSRLTKSDEARLAHEQQLFGELQINANASLPLVLNIAVITNGYHVTLDSPKQQSYGIPVDQFSISEQQLRFGSSMINASYQGTWQDGAWQGSFVQGQAIPLILKKKPVTQPLTPTLSKMSEWLSAEFGQHGVAIAWVDGQAVRYQLHGQANVAKQQAVSQNTMFEIGSITKPLTALAIIKQLQQGKWQLDTPLAQQSPLPELATHRYSLAELLTHRSGLPRLPANLPLDDLSNPYASYDEAALKAALAKTEFAEKAFGYSNFGYGLLGYLAGQQAKMPYASVMLQQVLQPLGMKTAGVQTGKQSYKDLASGYAISADTVPNWQFDSLAGAGAVVASIEDMATMLRHIFQHHAKDKALQQWLTALPTAEQPAMTPGWMLTEQQWLWHNGQTAGFFSLVIFDLKTEKGLVLLTNIAIPVTEQGFALFNEWLAQDAK